MAEYIDKSALYEEISQLEELARDRYLETPSNSPCSSRYMAQLNERTSFKHIIADFHSADVAPVRHGRWIIKHKHRGGFHRYTGIDDMGEQHTITVDERIEYDDRYCSECGKQSADNFLTYCPNCGARMDGDSDAKEN